MLHGRGIFNKPGLLRRAAGVVFIHRHRQRFGQEPEGDGRHEGDGAGDEVSQPPSPHPAGVARGDGHRLCTKSKDSMSLLSTLSGYVLLHFQAIFVDTLR